MITGLKVPKFSQRDKRWSGQRLGTVDGITIGSHGCLITCITMLDDGFDTNGQLTPNQVDDLFTANRGYANGDLVIWTAINRLLPNCALTAQRFSPSQPADVQAIKNHIQAGGLVILQVGFGGDPKQMHYVLAIGFNDGTNTIIFNDPWYGDTSNFETRRYGSGNSATDILAAHFFVDGINNTSVKVDSPVAARPTTPKYTFVEQHKKVVIDIDKLYSRDAPAKAGNILGEYHKGDVVEVVGYHANGETVNGTSTWYLSAGNTNFSGAFAHDYVEPTPDPAAEVPVPVQVIPEYQVSYRDSPEKNREVLPAGGTDVIDLTSGSSIHHLSQGEKVINIAGYFTVGGVDYARTQYAKDNNLWNGIKSHDLGSPEVSVPVQVVEYEDAEPEHTTEEIFGPLEGEIHAQVNKNWSRIWPLLKELFAIVLSPVLKLIGKKN